MRLAMVGLRCVGFIGLDGDGVERFMGEVMGVVGCLKQVTSVGGGS